MRPLGISAFEDKLVQDALREILSAVYEQDFSNCSYGFRPGRSAHDAIRVLDATANKGRANWIIEAANYGLSLHPDKTRLILFERPSPGQKKGKGPGTFDFLGFTMYWKRTPSGIWRPSFQTRSSRLSRAIQRIGEYCRRHRHLPVKEQHAGLSSRLRGHFNYFGINGNGEALNQVFWYAKHLWVKWLRRRSQKSRSWEHFRQLLKRFPLPAPRVSVRIWGK